MPGLKNLHTAPQLLTDLTRGAAKRPSADELFEQRVSFIYGSISQKSNVTREQIRKALVGSAGNDRDSVRANRD